METEDMFQTTNQSWITDDPLLNGYCLMIFQDGMIMKLNDLMICFPSERHLGMFCSLMMIRSLSIMDSNASAKIYAMSKGHHPLSGQGQMSDLPKSQMCFWFLMIFPSVSWLDFPAVQNLANSFRHTEIILLASWLYLYPMIFPLISPKKKNTFHGYSG